MRVELAQALAAVRSLVDGRSGPLEQRPDEAPDVVVVVDYEDPGSAHTSFIPRSVAGTTPRGKACLVATILIVDPDPANRSLLELLVLRLGHRPIGQRELAEGEEPDLMLLEPASRPGLRLAYRLRERLLRLPILCVSIEPPGEETSESRRRRLRDEAVPPIDARARARACSHQRAERSRGSAIGVGRARFPRRARPTAVKVLRTFTALRVPLRGSARGQSPRALEASAKARSFCARRSGGRRSRRARAASRAGQRVGRRSRHARVDPAPRTVARRLRPRRPAKRDLSSVRSTFTRSSRSRRCAAAPRGRPRRASPSRLRAARP